MCWALLLVPESPAGEEDVRQSEAATGFDSPEAGAAETGDGGTGEGTTPGARWGQGCPAGAGAAAGIIIFVEYTDALWCILI